MVIRDSLSLVFFKNASKVDLSDRTILRMEHKFYNLKKVRNLLIEAQEKDKPQLLREVCRMSKYV